jgi:two-component system, OmpR family, sensor histidine kinase ResE
LLNGQAALLVSVVQRSRLLREHQRIPPSISSFSLATLVQRLTLSYADAAARLEVELIQRTPARNPCIMRGDMNRIEIALGEVVDNALKHSPKGAQVEIRLSKVNNGYRLEVLDEGPGIPGSESRRIFWPYFSLSQGGGGPSVGLGLTIARGIISRHRGSITPKANPGERGTVFTIFLPTGEGLNEYLQ